MLNEPLTVKEANDTSFVGGFDYPEDIYRIPNSVLPIIMVLLASSLILTALISNLRVCFVLTLYLARVKSSLSKYNVVLLLTQNICDILTIVLLGMHMILRQGFGIDPRRSSNFLCKTGTGSYILTAGVSTTIIVLLYAERFYGTLYPLRFRMIYNNKYLIWGIITISVLYAATPSICHLLGYRLRQRYENGTYYQYCLVLPPTIQDNWPMAIFFIMHIFTPVILAFITSVTMVYIKMTIRETTTTVNIAKSSPINSEVLNHIFTCFTFVQGLPLMCINILDISFSINTKTTIFSILVLLYASPRSLNYWILYHTSSAFRHLCIEATIQVSLPSNFKSILRKDVNTKLKLYSCKSESTTESTCTSILSNFDSSLMSAS